VLSTSTLYAKSQPAAAGETEELVVTGTYNKESSTRLSSSISVIDQQSIQRLNKSNLIDVLRTIPGVLVEEQGGPGGLVSVSLRGGESNFTLVMVDGIELNDPTNTRGGSFDFGTLNLETVVRIEVARGPQSAIYGSGALSGAINIITTAFSATHQQSIHSQGGEKGLWKAALTANGEFDNLGYNLKLSTRDSGEPIPGSQQNGDDMTVALKYSTDQQQLRFHYRYADGERSSFPEESGGPLLAASQDLYRSDFNDKSLLLSWSFAASQHWQSTVKASHFEHQESYDSPGIVPYTAIPPYGADIEFSRKNLQWINRLGSQQMWANIGADYRREKGQSEGQVDFGFIIPTQFSLDRSSYGAFIDLNAMLTEHSLIQASIRADNADSAATQTSYKLGMRHSFNTSFVLWANWGQAYKLPSFFALGDSLTGNPDLVAETAESWDITAQWQFSNNRLRMTYFTNHFEQLVTFDNTSFRNINSEPIDSKGIELQWHWQAPSTPLSLQSHITYTDIERQDKSIQLTNRPRWKGGLSLFWQSNEYTHITIDYQYTGRQFSGSQHSGIGSYYELEQIQRVDCAINWELTPKLSVKGAIDNIFEQNYQTSVGFPAPGRSIRLGFNLKFGRI